MKGYGRIALVLLVIILLLIMPLPAFANYFRPALLFMFWFYMRIFIPERFNFLLLVLTALLMDVLLYSVLGQHAFAMVTSLWLINTRARRLVFFNLIQQMILVGVLVAVYLYLLAGIHMFMGHPVHWLQALAVALSSALIWPWFKLTLDDSLSERRTATA